MKKLNNQKKCIESLLNKIHKYMKAVLNKKKWVLELDHMFGHWTGLRTGTSPPSPAQINFSRDYWKQTQHNVVRFQPGSK